MINLKLSRHHHYITHHPSLFDVCVRSDNGKYIEYWNKNQRRKLTQYNENFTKLKWAHMALYVMAKYPQWNEI